MLCSVARGVEHDDGRRRLAGLHQEVGLGPSCTLGGCSQRERQGGVQAEVSLCVDVAELPVAHERLGWPARGAGIQRQGAGALHRDRRWSSEHRWPGQCLGEYGVDVPAVAWLLVHLALREVGGGARPGPGPQRQVRSVGHLSRRTRTARSGSRPGRGAPPKRAAPAPRSQTVLRARPRECRGG